MASSSQSKSSTTKKQVPAQADTESATVRLHIAPLTPETTASLIPESVLSEATRQSLSYHTIETFPEKSYAFLNLPKDQADKLKKRLNGSVFRGVKVRVEEARPETWVKHPEPEESMDAESAKKARKEERKEKRKRSKAEGEPKVKKRKKGEDGILEGIELPEGRKVQRGWTKPAVPTGVSAKYAGKASSTTSAKKIEDDSKRECLFKTPLPPNKATPKDEKKKDKEEKKDKKKRKREVVIKEFKNNTKFPQFLRVSQLDKDQAAEKMASEYVEGVGWVNAKGDVVEEERVKKRATKTVHTEVEVPKSVDAPKGVDVTDVSDASENDDDDDEVMVDAATIIPTEAKADSGDDSSSESESEVQKPISKTQSEKSQVTTKSDSSSESSSSESDEEDTTEKTSPITPVTPVSPTKPLRSSTTSPKTATPALQITIPTVTNPPIQAVHPLEALYKPTTQNTTLLQVGVAPSPASATAESSTFKFGFGADYDSDEEEEPVVQAPFRDRYRSAAPTPDTAIGHRKFFPDEDDGTGHGGKLGFVPSTPRVIGGFPGGQDLLSVRKDSTPYTPSTESPLLFPHSESRFLGALSVWSKLPTPKILTEEEPVEEEEEGQPKKKDRKKKIKPVEETEETAPGDKSMAEIWSEKFYENRGEWNRAWKQRRREALKQKNKKEAAGNPGAKRITA